MFRERWRAVRAGLPGAAAPPSQSSPRGGPGQQRADITRRSNGLEQFFGHMAGETGLTVLDLAGVSQENIAFITSHGHSLSSEDLVQSLDHEFGPGAADQTDPARIANFLDQNLNYFGRDFDGILAWDVLEYIAPPLLHEVVRRIHILMRPGSYIFALFHSEHSSDRVPYCSYKIVDPGTLLLHQRGERRPAQVFNNRAIEKLFEQFASVKFFLTRDNLREVIVRR